MGYDKLLICRSGGFAGAALRYMLGEIPVFNQTNLPVATLLINFFGAFLIGTITAVSLKADNMHPYLLLFLKVGLCGGFTTFSTFSLETIELLGSGRPAAAFFYSALSVIICLAAVYAGKAFINTCM